MKVTAIVQMSNDSRPSMTEDVGTGVVDVRYMKK